MRSLYARGVTLAIMLASLASHAIAQQPGSSGLLPLPPVSQNYWVSQTTATDALFYQGEPSPAQNPGQGPLPAPAQAPMQAPTQAPMAMNGDFNDAMKGSYDGCSSCGAGCGCGCGLYTYANAIVMTNYRMGGQVTSIDSTAPFGQRINFCNQEFNGHWAGGLETGIGYCFGCNCNAALELVYWGLYPATVTRTEVGGLNSLIDFSDLDYPAVGTNAQTAFDNAQIHQVQYDYSFNSVELNLVGTGLNGGPFGCGQFGCRPCGSRWGAGWVAGFRYLRLSDNFLFSADTTDQAFNGDPTEINYLMKYKNDLFGFQVGGGVSYYLTGGLSAYTTAKFGIYNNHVQGLQQVYGPSGNAVINNGPFNGQDFLVSSSTNALAGAGQWDLGGRWAVTDRWSINAGYRLMVLAGVATSDVNLKTAQFHDVDGIASPNCFGTFILHGAFAGASYRW